MYYYYPKIQIAQLVCCGVAALANIILALSPWYVKAYDTRVLRTILSGIVITIALFPVFFSVGIKYPALYGLGACVSYAIGGLVWVLHIPERFVPYLFDNNMNSHALMHVSIVVSHLLFYMFVFRGYQHHA